MKYSIGDWHYWVHNYDDETIFRNIKETGVDLIEIGIRFPEKDFSDERIKQLKILSLKYNIKINMCSLFLPPALWKNKCFISNDTSVSEKVVNYLIDIGYKANEIGIKTVGVWFGGDIINSSDNYDKAWLNMKVNLKKVLNLYVKLGLNLALEYKPGELINNCDSFLRMYDQLEMKNFGLLFDCGHGIMQGENIALVAEKAKDKIFHVHLDDNYGDYDRDMVPGTVHNFKPFIDKLNQTNYNGVLGFDIYIYLDEYFKNAQENLILSKNYMDSIQNLMINGGK